MRGNGPVSQRRRPRLRALAILLAGATTAGCAPGRVSVGVGVSVPAPWGAVSVATTMPFGPPVPAGPLWW